MIFMTSDPCSEWRCWWGVTQTWWLSASSGSQGSEVTKEKPWIYFSTNSIRRETTAASGPIRAQQWGHRVCLVQCRERLAGGAEPRSDRPSLLSSEWKNCCRRRPALASLVWRGLYWRQLENISSTSETNSPGDTETDDSLSHTGTKTF